MPRPFVKTWMSALLLLLSLLAGGAVALGQECARGTVTTAEEATERVNLLREDLCLGDQNCDSALCQKIAQLERTWNGKAAEQELVVQAAQIFREIRRSAAQLPSQGVGVAQLQGMLETWGSILSALGERPDAATIEASYTREWKPSVLRLFSGTEFQLDLEDSFETLCTSERQCQLAFESATEVYAHSTMVHRLLKLLIANQVEALGHYLETLDKRWHAFHNDSRGIYPWELLVNGWYYSPRQEGFSPPPSSQILLLHPSVGFAYRDSEQDKLSEVLVLDLAGLYWWKWGGQHSAEIVKPLGLALSASWDGDKVGYGLSAHFPKNWSLSVVSDDDGDISVLLSLDLANYLTNKKQRVDELREKFRAYR